MSGRLSSRSTSALRSEGARGYAALRAPTYSAGPGSVLAGLLFSTGQIKRHAVPLVAKDRAIHFVSARLQVHLQRTAFAPSSTLV